MARRVYERKEYPPLTPLQEWLVMDCQALLNSIVSGYFKRDHFVSRHLSRDDARQAGQLGLVLAARGFDMSKRIRFSTYATYCIRSQILGEANGSSIVQIPVWHSMSRQPAFQEAAKMALGCVSLPETWDDSVDATAERDAIDLEEHARLRHAINRLPPRQREVVLDVFYRDRGTTEIARTLGITRNGVQFVRNEAIKKLRRYLGVSA